MILQGRLPIDEKDSAESLQSRIHKIEHRLYPMAVKWFCQGRLSIENGQVLLDGETSDSQLQTFDV